MSRRNRWLLTLALVAAVLVALRLALEPILLDYANDKLDALNAYDGHIEDLDLALLRGGYDIRGIEIVKTGSGQPVPIKADAESGEFEQDQVAARIPLSGTIERPDADLLATIGSVMRNAFVSAFARSLEGSISVRSVRRSREDTGDGDRRERPGAGQEKP